MSTPSVFRLWMLGKELLPKWSTLPVSKDCWSGAEYVSDCHMIKKQAKKRIFACMLSAIITEIIACTECFRYLLPYVEF